MGTSPAAWAYRTLYTHSLAARGQAAEARRELAAQRAAGMPAGWPRDTNWLSAAKELSESAALLGDRELGLELEALLMPFRDRIVTNTRALICLGSVAGALARLAELAGDRVRAIELYRASIEREERAGAAIWAVHHRRRLGEALLAAGQPDRGLALLERVRREAPALGLIRVAALANARGGAGRRGGAA